MSPYKQTNTPWIIKPGDIITVNYLDTTNTSSYGYNKTLTQDFLVNQAQRLADYHYTNSGLITKVIRLDQIYNEFSSGSPDLTAIRDFAKHLYDNATTNQLKYI
mgnify:CR=1 FL=1